MTKRWTVIGGQKIGGVIVQIGQDVHSSQVADRLAFGAIVEELSLCGDRLQFKLVCGSGPDCGWVSIGAAGSRVLVPEASAVYFVPTSKDDEASSRFEAEPFSSKELNLIDTSALIGGQSNAGFVDAKDAHGHQTKVFFWYATAVQPQFLLIFCAGGPGAASSPYMLNFGPRTLSKDGDLILNESALTSIGISVLFFDVHAHVGFSSSPTKPSQFPYSDTSYAETAADAILQFANAGVSHGIPYVLGGESYGSKHATMVAASLLKRQPDFPLHAVIIQNALLDRVAAAFGWSLAFQRFFAEDDCICEKLRSSNLDELHVQATTACKEQRYVDGVRILDQMWNITQAITEARNQHNLALSARSTTGFEDGTAFHCLGRFGMFMTKAWKEFGAPKATFKTFLPHVFGVYNNTCRMADATTDLTSVIARGVRILVLTGEWDGMATIEGTTKWLEDNFHGAWASVNVGSAKLSPAACEVLGNNNFVHAVVSDASHHIFFDQPDTLRAVIASFLKICIEGSSL